jgi:preprotein translocase subunit SecE
MKQKIIDFFNGVTKEMKKVTWPTKDELRESTVVVLATTVIMALFVFMVDTVFTEVLKALLG